ncbi:uncharacterized protein LOC117170954 [Belonocnema kinseyi]|uniref:uncharacterized protein LOC117170954 n=1 Tax=Belonocnema kinseyi TaxID=2817044 RepID=UPI00143DE87C|nr:uncharacterized protein LOC117170954 [Belonocnema kinseyi]
MRYRQQPPKCSRRRVFQRNIDFCRYCESFYYIIETTAKLPDMTRSSVKRRHSDLPQFESVARISSFPIVESGIYIAGNVYDMIKRSNSLMCWSLDTAEHSLALATASAKPAIFALNGPIATIDHLLCKGIDMVEQRVPAVNLPPQIMYWNTREYVNNKIVRPVLKRADSVKQISSLAAYAAVDTLDGALTVADEYIDHYLPGDPGDKVAEVDANPVEETSKTVRTIKHGARFSRKLQRRLTRRTMAEAKALKEQGTECIAVLLYVAELVATDPKLAYQKAKELWATLSLPEPENQARPATLEQFLVLLTRELARRIVHLVNATAVIASRSPRFFGRLLVSISHQMLSIADATVKMTPVVGKLDSTLFKKKAIAVRDAIDRLHSPTNVLLEQLAAFLAGRPKAPKITHNQNRQQNHNNHRAISPSPPVNGIEYSIMTETQQLPQLEIFHRVLELPTIEFALSKSASTYFRVKASYQLVNWALSTAESSLTSATRQAVPIAAPIAKKFETPIHFFDHTLCLGLDKIEEKMPMVKEQPEQILENAYMLALQTMRPPVIDLIISQATSLKDISWNKVNQILSTHYGSMAVEGIDNTAVIVDNLIDKYFPPVGEEEIVERMASEAQKPTSSIENESPHFGSLDRIKNIPVISSAIERTGSTYSYLKDSNYLVNWALSHAEAGLHYATAAAAPIATPLAKKFEGQISAVDQKLCQGLDAVEKKVPMVKQPPQQIYDAAKEVMNSTLQPTIDRLVSAKQSATQQATSLKDISINKANEILSTRYGALAVQSVDSTSALVNKLLDHYFPPAEGEDAQPAPVSAEENKVLHAVQTVGQLSSKTANRVYHSVAAQLRTVKKEDVSTYISNVVSILHLTYFLNVEKKDEASSPKNGASEKSAEKSPEKKDD